MKKQFLSNHLFLTFIICILFTGSGNLKACDTYAITVRSVPFQGKKDQPNPVIKDLKKKDKDKIKEKEREKEKDEPLLMFANPFIKI